TGRTPTSAVYPGRPALDGPFDFGMAAPGDRPDPNRVHAGVVDLSSPFPTCLASPFLSHRDDLEPLITRAGGTACDRHGCWHNLPSRGASADHGQEGWRAALCG